VETYLVDLNELAALPSLNNRDYYATERLLQVLIEACIGIAKHGLKYLVLIHPYRQLDLSVMRSVIEHHLREPLAFANLALQMMD